ncbi:MAG: hypothetical protein JWM43_3659 [Acidobacteriaceae bacterium]|nr:hypothetical protein [Acidobacteriaceae bacterium]
MQATVTELSGGSTNAVPIPTVKSISGSLLPGASFSEQQSFAERFGELIRGALKAGKILNEKAPEGGGLAIEPADTMPGELNFFGLEDKNLGEVPADKMGQAVAIDPSKKSDEAATVVAALLPSDGGEVELAHHADLDTRPTQHLTPKVSSVQHKNEGDGEKKSVLAGSSKKVESWGLKLGNKVEAVKNDVDSDAMQPIASVVSDSQVIDTPQLHSQQVVSGTPAFSMTDAASEKERIAVPSATGSRASAPQIQAGLPTVAMTGRRSIFRLAEMDSSISESGANDKDSLSVSGSVSALAVAGGIAGGPGTTTQHSAEASPQLGGVLAGHRETGSVGVSSVGHDPSPSVQAHTTHGEEVTLAAEYDAGLGRVVPLAAGSPTVLEVGITHGTNGWLKVRAEMDDGRVMASLASSTVGGREMLHRELPALSVYLQGENVGVNTLTVKETSAPPNAGSGEANGMFQGADSSRQEREGAAAGSSEPVALTGSESEEEWLYNDVSPLAEGGGLMPVLAAGSWLNIRV